MFIEQAVIGGDIAEAELGAIGLFEEIAGLGDHVGWSPHRIRLLREGRHTGREQEARQCRTRNTGSHVDNS